MYYLGILTIVILLGHIVRMAFSFSNMRGTDFENIISFIIILAFDIGCIYWCAQSLKFWN